MIDAQAEEVMRSEDFTELDHATLTDILSRDTLVAREFRVFTAACRWADAEARRRGLSPSAENKRLVLGSALYRIRVPTLSIDVHANEVARSGVLSVDESHNVFLHHCAQIKPQLPFDAQARRGLEAQRCSRFQSCAYRTNQWRYRGRCDSIMFSVDRRIFVAGYGLYGSSNGAAEYEVHMELKLDGRVLGERTTTFQSNGTKTIYAVYFDVPIQVDANTFYTSNIVIEGAELSHFGQDGLPEVTQNQTTFLFQCSSESTNGTGVHGGQIPEIIFYC